VVKETEEKLLKFSRVSQSMNRFKGLWLKNGIVVVLMCKEQNKN